MVESAIKVHSKPNQRGYHVMRQQRALPDYRNINVKIPLDVLERLLTEARRQERSLSGEVCYRLKLSFGVGGGDAAQAEDEAA